MAGFDWNEYPQNRRCPSKQQIIACRICDRVFMSTQDLINHIDVHLVEDDALIRRQTDQINRMLSQRGHFMGNAINPYYRPHFSEVAHLRGPPMSVAVVNPQPQPAFQRKNYSRFPPPPPPAAATPGSHQVLMSHPIVPSQFRASRISQHGPVLLPGGTNMPQMVHNVPQMVHYLPIVEPPAYRNLPTNVLDAVKPQGHHRHNNNNASDDSTEIDLTLRL